MTIFCILVTYTIYEYCALNSRQGSVAGERGVEGSAQSTAKGQNVAQWLKSPPR